LPFICALYKMINSCLWLPYGIGQTIIFLPCVSSSSFFFHTWCGLSANLGCMSETCCTLLAENTGCKKVAKNRHLGTIAQLCRATSSQLRHLSTFGKNLLSSNTNSTCPHDMANFGPLTALIGWPVWAPLQISTGFVSWQRYCTASGSGRQPNCGVEQRALPIFGRATITLGIGPHFSVSQKKGATNHGYNFVNSWWICKILSLLERPVNFQQHQ